MNEKDRQRLAIDLRIAKLPYRQGKIIQKYLDRNKVATPDAPKPPKGFTPSEMRFIETRLGTLDRTNKDFKTKATVIFENAVAGQLVEEKKVIEEEYERKLEEQRKEIEESFEEKIDSYLTYVAEEWMKENELAVENGIQVEIAENFLKGMKDLFTEAYVEVPESKVDVVAEMVEELEKKTSVLDKEIDKNIQLQEQFKDRVKSIVETYFTKSSLNEDKDDEDKDDEDKDDEDKDDKEKTDESMKRYVDALSESMSL